MIRFKNLGNKTVELSCPGVLTAATNKDSALVPFDGFITNIVASMASGGSGVTSSIVDVNYIGTSIFNDTTKLTFAATTGTVTYDTLANDPYSVTQGALLTLDVDSISTTPAGLKVKITISKNNPATCTNLTNEDVLM